jgi:uncharacterized repeat protein (TIGR04052 family)
MVFQRGPQAPDEPSAIVRQRALPTAAPLDSTAAGTLIGQDLGAGAPTAHARAHRAHRRGLDDLQRTVRHTIRDLPQAGAAAVRPTARQRISPLCFFFVSFAVTACADDTTSTEPDAVERSDAAADGGKKQNAPRTGSKADNGHPNARDAAADAALVVKDAGQPSDENLLPVKLRFRAQIGDRPLACGDTYDDQGSTKRTISLRDLRLFVQDVALVDADAREVPVQLDTRDPWQTTDVALLDFEDASGECFGDEATNHEITGVVPRGEYRAVRFSHGVPEQLNHSDPETFPAPLQTPGMSWNWLLGLRFVRFEVGTEPGADLDADGGADPGSFSLHVGSTGCAGNQNAGTIKCAKPNRSRVELKDFELSKSEIVLDVSSLLSASDLTQTIECHSGTEVCNPLFKALGVSYTSGEPATGQTVFRLK